MEHVLTSIQNYFDTNIGSSRRNDNIDRCMFAVKKWISNKREFKNVAENYKFLALNVLPMWNEVMAQSITSQSVFTVHDIIFDLLTNLPSDVKDSGWLKIQWKISLKYAGKLISVQKYQRAVTCLDFAEKQIQEMYDSQPGTQTYAGGRENTTSVDAKKDLLICHLYRVEVYSALENYLDARNSLQKIKYDLLESLDELSRKYMTALCFNIGLAACQKEKYEESVFWLTQSHEMSESADENQTSLLLLAESHMMLGGKQHYEDAIVALQNVDSDHKDFNTNLMKLKARIGSDAAPDDIRKIILHCYKPVDMSEDKLLQMFEALQRCNQKCLLHEAMLTFESILSLSQVGKSYELHLKTLLKENLLDEADQVVKNFLNALNHSIRCNEELPSTEEMLMILNCQASLFQEKSEFERAVCWFDYCIQISHHVPQSASDLRNLKFYQQKCNCLLELGLNSEAKETLLLAEEQMANHIINKYLRLKLCIILNEESEAISVIESFDLHPNYMDDSDDIAKILMLCAEFGLNKLRIRTTVRIFESIIGKLTQATSIVAVLRSIIRLKLQGDFSKQIDQEWMYGFLPKVHKCLDLISADKTLIANEAKWFTKVFWNIAHGDKDNPLFVHRLLDCCGKMLRFCDPNDTIALVQRNSCILISVAAGLEVVRFSIAENKNPGQAQELITSLTKNILENINEFKICNVKFDQELSTGFRTTQRLLLICEFEVKAILHCHDLEDVFERAVSLPDIDEKTFELLAAIAHRGGSHCYSLTVRSLRAAIGKLLEKPRDYEHLCRLYHSLLYVVSAKMENNTAYKTDFGKFINEIYELVKSAPDGKFPQSELLWFVTKTWNNSIKLYLQFGRHNEAMAWSQLAIGMSDHMLSLKEVYRTKMKQLYDQMSQPSPGSLDAKEK